MVNSKNRCVIVAASPQTNVSFIKSQISENDFIICADGGADKLAEAGITPDWIIGDLDSSSNYAHFENTNVTVLPTQKDDTDTMYCVKKALEKGFKSFLFLGATGGRIDHTLANLSVLLYLKKNNAVGIISDEFADTFLLNIGDNVFENVKGRTISVMPFASDSVRLTYKGMMYPLENAVVKTEYPFSISNVAVSDTTVITLHSGTALIVLPRKEWC